MASTLSLNVISLRQEKNKSSLYKEVENGTLLLKTNI